MNSDMMFKINEIVIKYSDKLYKEHKPPYEGVDNQEIIKDLQRTLKYRGINTNLIKGKIIFDNSKELLENEHCWLEYNYRESGQRKKIQIDITARKYQFYINEHIPTTIVGVLPRYYSAN